MNPLEQIKGGILENNWQYICDGYEAMTGEKLPVPPQESLTVDNLKQTIINVLKNDPLMLAQLPDPIEVATAAVQMTETKGLTISAEKVGHYGNKTVLVADTPTKEEIEEGRKLAENRKGPKIRRQPYTLHNVKCSSCDKVFKSPIKDSNFGQKCKACLRGLRDR